MFVTPLLFTSSCNDEPPVTPEPQPDMGCKVEGDININYESAKGFIGSSSDDRFQLFFSSYQVIDGIEYGLIISLFPENITDTSGTFPIIHYSDDKPTGNFSWAAFVVNNGKPNEIQFWADSGQVNMSRINIGKKTNRLKGTFYFRAYEKYNKSKMINVTDGWVDLEQKF